LTRTIPAVTRITAAAHKNITNLLFPLFVITYPS
jgi:hypothetical protein